MILLWIVALLVTTVGSKWKVITTAEPETGTNFMHSTSCCLCRIWNWQKIFLHTKEYWPRKIRNIDKKDKDIDQLVDVDYNNQYLKTSSGCVCRIQIDRIFFCTQRDIDQKRYGYWPKKTRILNNSLMLITTIRVWKLISCIQLLVVCAALKLTEDFFAQKGILTKKDKDIDQLIDVYFNNQYLKTNFMHPSSGCLCRIDINFACRLFFGRHRKW